MGPEFMIARRHFRSLRARRRISFTIGIAAVGVALGVSSLVIVMSVMNGYTNMIRERLLGVNAHLTVRKSYRKSISDYGPVIRTLEDHPEVLAASPFIHAEGFVFRKPAAAGVVKSGVLVRSVDPGSCWARFWHKDWMQAPGTMCTWAWYRRTSSAAVDAAGSVTG